MSSYSRDEVVLIRYPFSDLSGSKVRPAIIVSAPHPSIDVLIVPLSSKVTSLLPGEFVLKDWSQPGLNILTAVKRGIYTVQETLVIKKVGQISATDSKNLQRFSIVWDLLIVGQVSNLPHTACWGRLESCPTTHAIENRCRCCSASVVKLVKLIIDGAPNIRCTGARRRAVMAIIGSGSGPVNLVVRDLAVLEFCIFELEEFMSSQPRIRLTPEEYLAIERHFSSLAA